MNWMDDLTQLHARKKILDRKLAEPSNDRALNRARLDARDVISKRIHELEKQRHRA